jgi:hypothetical protein
MANGLNYNPLSTVKTDAVFLTAKLTGGGVGLTLTVSDPVVANSEVVSLAWVSTGKYTGVLRRSFPQLLTVIPPGIVATTVGLAGRFTAFDPVAKTFALDLTVGSTLTDAALTDTVYLNWVVRNSGKNQ